LFWEITITRINDPIKGLKSSDVEKTAQTLERRDDLVSLKISRIKAVRMLRPGTSLKDAKEWVEYHTFP
jgi:ribosomal protein L7/L12